MPPLAPGRPRYGLVLPAGGARAAYQVGVLRTLAEKFPELKPRIFTGVSAGSINACYLAQGDDFAKASAELYRLWEGLYFDQVFRTNFKSLFRMFLRWAYDMFLSKVTDRLLLRSLLDASPLAKTLLGGMHFWKIHRAIRSGDVDGLAISATNYHDGTTMVFFDSHEAVEPWRREQRRAHRTAIHVKHVMASCSIPILFEPVRIGDRYFGDGALRFSYPLSPAIHLGASHVLAIGTKCAVPETPTVHRERAGLGFVAGAVLNSIFLDSLEADFENLQRINRISHATTGVKAIPALLLRPSRDLGALAAKHVDEVPFHLRQILKSTAGPSEMGDLLSYLMFSPGYLGELLRLGREDAEREEPRVAAFLSERIP